MVDSITLEDWIADRCPGCDGNLRSEPLASCGPPPLLLLHWLAYLSEDRICESWGHGCQARVLGWCTRNVVPPGNEVGFMEVTRREADAVLAAAAEAETSCSRAAVGSMSSTGLEPSPRSSALSGSTSLSGKARPMSWSRTGAAAPAGMAA